MIQEPENKGDGTLLSSQLLQSHTNLFESGELDCPSLIGEVLPSSQTAALKQTLISGFSLYNVLKVLITDNGPQILRTCSNNS